MATPPPLIRSTKPFSVEIPEGSNSAKARRSDVVGSDELSISAKKHDFKNSDATLLPEMHHEPASKLAQRSAQHADALSFEDLHVNEEAALHAPHMVHEDNHAEKNIQGLGADALSDRQVDLPPTDPLKRNLQAVDNGTLKDNLQALGKDTLKDNLQAVPGGSLKDNLQAIDDDALQDNLQSVAQDAIAHRDVGIDKEHFKDNMANETAGGLHSDAHGLPKEGVKDRTVGEIHNPLKDRQASAAKDAIKDHLQGLPDDTLDDNLQPLDHHDISDNQQAVDNPAITDNQASLDNDSIDDNLQAVDNPALANNQAGIDSDALENRTAETDKEHVHDHVVALPDQHTPLKEGPKPGAQNKSSQPATDDKHGSSVKSAASAKASAKVKEAHSVQTEQLQAAKLEQARKMGEFHGRVEALKKTVSGINHLLDELEEKKPEKKS